MTVAAIVQARMTSTRLPGKVLLPLRDEPMLARVLERVARVSGVDRVSVAVPEGAEHNPVAGLAKKLGSVAVMRGSEQDVLDRTLRAAEACDAEIVMRVTSDCPMIDPAVSAAVLAAFRACGADYARTAFTSGYPHGFDTEVFSIASLRAAHAEAIDAYEREHVTPFIWRRPERFDAVYLDARPDRRSWRLTVDSQEDYRLACDIYEALHADNPQFGYADIVSLFAARSELKAVACRAVGDPLSKQAKAALNG